MWSSSCVLSLLVVLSFHFVVANSSRSLQLPSCDDEESSALLQFKQSFVDIDPSVLSWKPPRQGENNTCCSWDGVECDEKTGHVIGLDLSNCDLYGSINSNSTLFSLVHLQRLNLAFNDFNNSQIPTSIGNFPRLRYLDLSYSVFSGFVPSEISQLSKLSSLDLSGNEDMFSNEELFSSLAQNLTGLETLDLSSINISSIVPSPLANLSFLTSLLLDDCGLFGELPVRIFKLKFLKVLSIRDNPNLTGYFPENNGSSPLVSLKLASTTFFVNLSSLIEKLDSLKELDVRACSLEGSVPFSLFNLRYLIYLDLSNNKFNGQIPSLFGNLTQLRHLSLHGNNFHGSIPESLFNLINLRSLSLSNNNLSGTVEMHMFHKLQNLTALSLSRNKLEVLTEFRVKDNATVLPKFKILGLGWCNIREFPNFLRSQETLEILDLSGNKFQAQLPKWMWNTSTQTLQFMYISDNFLSGFDQPPAVLPWLNIIILDLSFNELRGSLLIPSTSIMYYKISDNKLTGEVSPSICNLSSLHYLDLSNNKLSGKLPQCVGNFSDDLEYLNLRNNSFHGIVPQTYTNTSKLRIIDVSYNQLQGQLPRSLSNCVKLEALILSSNEFDDVFPSWLGTLQELKVLAMRFNGFYGGIGKHKKSRVFPELLILDLAYNNFTGEFPSVDIFSGYSMGDTLLPYRKDSDNAFLRLHDGYYFWCSITITNKGIEINYPKIQDELAVVDISSNRFEGKIPEFIGNLQRLRLLNISNNIFTDCIPSSLGNLTLLESLDLSQNKFSGEIPQRLAHLTFLAKLNVSHNYLTGPIPGGTQLSTFDLSSYEGNPGLCGDPLPKKCENPNSQLSTLAEEENDSGSGLLDWKFVLAGLGSGSVVGVVLADSVILRWSEWFIEIAAVLSTIVKRMRMPRN